MSRLNYVCLHILKGIKHGEILFKCIACYSVIMQDPYESVVSCSIVGWLNCSLLDGSNVQLLDGLIVQLLDGLRSFWLLPVVTVADTSKTQWSWQSGPRFPLSENLPNFTCI